MRPGHLPRADRGRLLPALSAALLALAGLLSGAARAQDLGTCVPVTQLPFTISAPGYYCLESDLASAGSGIMVNASDVTIDLGGNELRGPGVNTQINYCILAFGRARIKIRNGTIRGCAYGIYLSDFADAALAGGGFQGGYHRIEDLRISNMTFRGMRIEGNGNVVRRVDLRFIGGDLFYPSSSAIGIESVGPGARIVNNTLHEVRGGGPGDAGLGIGISLSRMASGSIVQDNTLSNSALEPGVPYNASWPAPSRRTVGLWIGDLTSGVLVEGNALSTYQTAVQVFRTARALLARNTVSNSTKPFEMGAANASDYGGGNVCDIASCLTLVP